MRGTNADMTLILFNGHSVSGGDWYPRRPGLQQPLHQPEPDALVGAERRHRLQDLAGGHRRRRPAGTVNVTTRRPLKEAKKFGGLLSVGGVYADLPAKTSPQLNASMNWKNDSNTFGVIGQLFAEKRYVRRDSSRAWPTAQLRLGRDQHDDDEGHHRRVAGRHRLHRRGPERRAPAGQHGAGIRRGRARPQGAACSRSRRSRPTS